MALIITGTARAVGTYVHCDSGREGLTGIVPFELVDDELRGKATPEQQRTWIEKHSTEIEEALRTKSEGRPVGSPFDRIVVGGRP